MFCPNCGSEIGTDDRFCPECGCGQLKTDCSPGIGGRQVIPVVSELREGLPMEASDRSAAIAVGQPQGKRWALPIAAIVCIVAVCVGAFALFGLGDARGTWYQSNNYYGYEAVMQLDASSYSIASSAGGKWSGKASVGGGSITIDDYTYELQDAGQKLVCISNKGTNVFAGEWYRSADAAAAHPRNN